MYERPSIKRYGSLAELTADEGVLGHVGLATMSLSVPLTPGTPGGPVPRPAPVLRRVRAQASSCPWTTAVCSATRVGRAQALTEPTATARLAGAGARGAATAVVAVAEAGRRRPPVHRLAAATVAFSADPCRRRGAGPAQAPPLANTAEPVSAELARTANRYYDRTNPQGFGLAPFGVIAGHRTEHKATPWN